MTTINSMPKLFYNRKDLPRGARSLHVRPIEIGHVIPRDRALDKQTEGIVLGFLKVNGADYGLVVADGDPATIELYSKE